MSEFSEAIYNRYLVHLNSVKKVESVLINIKSSEPEIVNNNESKPRNVKDVLDKEQVQKQKQGSKDVKDELDKEQVQKQKQVSNDVKDVLDKEQAQKQKQGEAFTKLGPAPYAGSILDDPELLWTDDIWNEEREKEAQSKLSLQGNVVSDYWKTQYETKAGSFWHKFYKRNADHFYKDRHYLHVVFPELMTNSSCSRDSTEPLYLLEIGCGVGNAVLPLIELNPNLHVIAMDFANSAIEILNKHPFTHSCVDHLPSRCLDTSQLTATYNLINTDNNIVSAVNQRVRTAVRCIVKDFLPVPAVSMDLALCMFVLSAIAPSEQLGALQKIADILKPGGKLLVRDYGR